MTSPRRLAGLFCAALVLACDGTEPIVGNVEGVVSVEGEPVASASVTLTSDTVRTIFTDAGGAFSFQVGGGTYTVSVQGTPPGASFTRLVQPAQITTSGQRVRADFDGQWIRTSVIAGTVQANGEPAVDIGVSVSGPSAAETRTDAQGAFRLAQLRAGAYTVTLSDFDEERYDFSQATFAVTAGVDGSVEVGFQATLLPPAPPSALQSERDGPYRILVSWRDDSSYEVEYRVARRVEDGEWSDLAILDADAVGFPDEDLVPGTRYAYRVRACNEIGCSTGDLETEARTEQVPPAAPEAFSAQADGAFRVALEWSDKSFNESGFHLERRLTSEQDWVEIIVLDAGVTSHLDQGLAPETGYTYRLRACNEVGCSEHVGPESVTTPELPPERPTGLAAASAGASRIDLSWSDRSDSETGFLIQRRFEASAWSAVHTTTPGATAYSDPGLAPGTTYVYRVLACNDGGCSEASNEASATTDQTPPPAPASLTATATMPDRVELSWQYNGSNETGLHLERRVKNQGSFAEIAELPPGTTSHADQGVETGKTFQYRVRACNAVGCSSYSAVAEATTVTPPENNLQVAAMHLTQVIQGQGGGVPLVEGRSGLLRVFVTTGLANTFQPDVRVRLFDGANMVQETVVSAPSGSVPLDVQQGSLDASWNVSVPSSLIKPGLGVQIDVDPSNAVTETNEGDNRFPASGTHTFDVRTTNALSVTFVPVRQNVNGTEGSASPSKYTSAAQSMFPVPAVGGAARATYVTDAPELQSDNGNGAWGTILSEIYALRAADGASNYYYGAVQVTYGGGVAGMGYVGAPAAIGWDKGGSAGVAAHEWGHNFGRRHAPCGGAGGPDPSFPYSDGSIGQWGYNGSSLRSPSQYKDLMGYCSPDWISDYTYNGIMSVMDASTAPPASAPRPVEDGLLIWGRIDGHGVVLEPAFEVRAPALLPDRAGPHTIRALDRDGTVILDLAFTGLELPEEAGFGSHFAFVVPLSALGGRTLSSLRLEAEGTVSVRSAPPADSPGTPPSPGPSAQAGAEGDVDVTWDATRFPMALVRDPVSGDIVSFARGGRVRVPVRGRTVEVTLSDGVTSRRELLVLR